MATQIISPRNSALNLLNAALDTGVRGANRDAIRQAISVLENTKRGDLSDLHYQNLPAGGKLVDPDRPGLVMRHGKRTGKIWLYRFDHPETHKQTEFQFGRYPEMPTSEAREVWQRMRRQRLDGHNPSLSDDAGDADVPTIEELVHRYIREYARKVNRPRSVAEDHRMLAKHLLPDHGGMPATKFTRDHVAAILLGIKEGGAPREAEKVRAVLLTMFNVARGKTRKISLLAGTWLPPDSPNPVETVTLERRAAKSHKPTTSELRAYARNLCVLGVYGAVLRVQLETCARIGEVTGMRWAELDLDDRVWLLPADRAKNHREHKVMLAEQTTERLRSRRDASASEFVFPAIRDASRQLRTDAVVRVLADNRNTLGVSGSFTSHAIRHACLTWLAEQECPRELRDRVSNHAPASSGGVDHVYNAAELNRPAREWLQRWVDYLSALEADNVVAIDQHRR